MFSTFLPRKVGQKNFKQSNYLLRRYLNTPTSVRQHSEKETRGQLYAGTGFSFLKFSHRF